MHTRSRPNERGAAMKRAIVKVERYKRCLVRGRQHVNSGKDSIALRMVDE